MAILGIDIGGTKTIVGVYADGALRKKIRVEYNSFHAPMDYLNAILDAARRVLAEAGIPVPKAIGIGCGGPLDRKNGSIVSAPNMPGWDNLPLTAIFANEFNAPA